MKYRSIFLLGVLMLLISGDVLADNNDTMVANSAEEICPLKIGEGVPQLTLRTIDNEEFDLNRAISQKPTILIFYRGSW